MKKLNDKLSDALDIEPIDLENNMEIIETPQMKSTIEDDAEYARQNIRELIDKGSIAIDNLLHVAKDSQHPRAYEVAANMLKNLTDMNKDLMEIQKRKKELSPVETQNAKNINVDKAVFVGSTAELVKFLKSNKE
jgi:hypothetical protein